MQTTCKRRDTNLAVERMEERAREIDREERERERERREREKERRTNDIAVRDMNHVSERLCHVYQNKKILEGERMEDKERERKTDKDRDGDRDTDILCREGRERDREKERRPNDIG